MKRPRAGPDTATVPIVTVRRHHEAERPPGIEEEWTESHRLDVFVPDRGWSLSLMATKHPGPGRASYVATLLRHDEDPIVLVEQEVPLPKVGWEFRASGLWADHNCETPLDHWSYGLEAFALCVDNPSDWYRDGVGQRVPLGWEIEFEATHEAGWLGPDCYQQLGTTHGVVLLAGGSTEVEGRALRTHWWGLGGPVELHVGRNHRPVTTKIRVPSPRGTWQIDSGRTGLRVRVL